MTSEEKRCPYCDEVIRRRATRCKHCGSDLPAELQTPASEISTSIELSTNGSARDGSVCATAVQQVSLKEQDIPELLSKLVDRSLVAFDTSSGRYQLSETVRQYARDRLFESEPGGVVRDRHLTYFESLARLRSQAIFDGLDIEQRWTDEIQVEHDNVRAALQWSLSDAALTEYGFSLAASLQCFWIARAMGREEAEWLDTALEISSGNPNLRLARARATIQYWWAKYFIGEAEGITEPLESCLAECRQLDDAQGIARALHTIGMIHAYSGQPENARKSLLEALHFHEKTRDRYGLFALLNDMGEFERTLGFYDAARQYYERSIESCTDWGSAFSTFARANLGAMAAVEGDTATATPLLRSSLSDCLRFGYVKPVSGNILTAVALLVSSVDPQGAARLIGAIEAFHAASGTRFETADAPVYERAKAAVLERLSTREYEESTAEGAAMDWRTAGQYALANLLCA